ncbi:MAG: tRNA uridine-5-carboxymethylaminomethyl(34) synthesis GTPase MnmE [Sphingomonadaceae bacterium]
MTDTIYALSSGQVPAGVAVIRLSGPGAFPALSTITNRQELPPPRTAMLRSIYKNAAQQVIDRALIIIFPGPRSFTGEDVVEIHCHGSPAVVIAVQQLLGSLDGLRPAEPGEFTRRAFETGRIDLTQAEALSDLLAAETEAQRDQAISNAGGRLREQADTWRERIIALMADVEADLDFSDEGDVETARDRPDLDDLVREIEQALASAPIGERIRSGLTIAIIGPPNSGKSSLVNILSRRDVAIVTPHAGTTRDIIEVRLDLGGIPATLLDTAGLRETSDPIEREGIARGRARAAEADLILDMGDTGGDLKIINKIDLSGERPGIRGDAAWISATTGAGLPELEQWLIDRAQQHIPEGEPPLVSHARQAHWLAETLKALREARLEEDIVLRAEALRKAGHALGRLTGRIDPESVLDMVFSRFCIGK